MEERQIASKKRLAKDVFDACWNGLRLSERRDNDEGERSEREKVRNREWVREKVRNREWVRGRK